MQLTSLSYRYFCGDQYYLVTAKETRCLISLLIKRYIGFVILALVFRLYKLVFLQLEKYFIRSILATLYSNELKKTFLKKACLFGFRKKNYR